MPTNLIPKMMNIGIVGSNGKPWERPRNKVYPTKPEIVGCECRTAGREGITLSFRKNGKK